jgi:hypothetical protein
MVVFASTRSDSRFEMGDGADRLDGVYRGTPRAHTHAREIHDAKVRQVCQQANPGDAPRSARVTKHNGTSTWGCHGERYCASQGGAGGFVWGPRSARRISSGIQF